MQVRNYGLKIGKRIETACILGLREWNARLFLRVSVQMQEVGWNFPFLLSFLEMSPKTEIWEMIDRRFNETSCVAHLNPPYPSQETSICTSILFHYSPRMPIPLLGGVRCGFNIQKADSLEHKKAPPSLAGLSKFIQMYYKVTPSATTSCTSGTMRLSRFSMPAFKVTVADGQPLQEPCRFTVTTPWL